MAITDSPVDPREMATPWLSTWNQAVVLLLITIGAYFQTWTGLWPYWEGENASYAHGTLVVLAAVWLSWRMRRVVNRNKPIPSAHAVPIVLLLSAIWVLAERANVFIAYVTLWPILAFVVLLAGLGLNAANRFALPLGFLYFAVPIWEYLKPPLQAITTAMVGIFTHLLGIPAALDGNHVTLPTGRLFIAEDCSGAYFLCVALAVGVIAAVLRRDDLLTGILILFIAGLLSMTFNWLRVLLIILAALNPILKGGLEAMGGHLSLGWWVFALDLFVFSLILRLIPVSRNQHNMTAQPDHAKRILRSKSNSGGMLKAATVAILLPAVAWAAPRFDTYPTGTPSADLRSSAAADQLISPDLYWSPHFPGSAWDQRFAVRKVGGIAIEIYANRYHRQTQGRELISQGSRLFDPLYFSSSESRDVHLLGSNGQRIAARREILIDSTGTSWLAFYTYFVDNEPIANGRRVQLLTALRSIYARTTAGVIAVAAPCVETCKAHASEVEGIFIRVLEDYRRAMSG